MEPSGADAYFVRAGGDIGVSAQDKPLAIVTGGSSGIGQACAAELLRLGCTVALIARDLSRLELARENLTANATSASVIIRVADVCDHAGIARTINDLMKGYGPPRWLVCSSGMARPGLFLNQSLDDHVEHMQTNYLGLVATVKAAANAMVQSGSGHVVLISSGASFMGIYGYSAYAPSKFAVRALGEILQLELEATGVSVTVACPPDTDTPQLFSENLTKPRATSRITAGGGMLSSQAVAKEIINGALKRRSFVGPGWRMYFLYSLHSLVRPVFRFRQRYIIRHV